MDTTKSTPELFGALAKAQAAARTVGKDGNNTHGGYRYATAEAMIRSARECMAGNGLSIFSTFAWEPATGDHGDAKQWVGGTVKLSWVLAHESGGVVSGVAEMPAVCSMRRPDDKASMAAATYARGFLLRDLLNLDRAEEGESVDARGDTGFAGKAKPKPPQPAARTQKQHAPPVTMGPRDQNAWRDALTEARRVGIKIYGEQPSWMQTLREATGKDWPDYPTAEDVLAATDSLAKLTEEWNAKIAAELEAEVGDPT
jgi:hypothetical protein